MHIFSLMYPSYSDPYPQLSLRMHPQKMDREGHSEVVNFEQKHQ